MPGHTGSQPETDQTNAPSVGSGVEETAAVPSVPSRAAPTSGFGPSAVAGEVGTLGPYRVVKELGKGGMGAVYAALDARLDRRLALKVMLPEFAADANAKERFLREARAAARVKHDNVVTVYEADERNGMPYIAMEFLEGFPLDVFLKKKGTPTIAQTLRIGTETAAGLAAAHKIGLVHRDIKPANLWLEAPHGRVKVLDFGLARPVDAETELTKSGAVVGTPAYMSPEQARGEKVDHRTDLFSLGAVLYRLCTGTLPFSGPTTMAVLMALGTEEPPPVRERNPAVPEALAALIHQLLSKRAEDRPQSALDVVKRLRAIAQELAAPRPTAAELSVSQPQLVQPQVMYVPIPVPAPAQNPFADLDEPGEDRTEQASAAPAPEPERKAERKKPRGFGPLLIAGGLLALAVVAAAGVIIVIKNKDGTETKIEVPDGATVTVKDKGGKTLAQVGPGGKEPVAGADPDRKAAEYALSLGGVVRVSGLDRDLMAAADLPKERFTLTGLDLTSNAKVTDAGLVHFKDCTGLTCLVLAHTAVTDAGLVNFKDCKNLVVLYLGSTAVTDAGLTHFTGCKNLTRLGLDNCPAVTDAGLAHFKGCKGLFQLNLGGTQVTDAGLAHFQGCKALTQLSLGSTAVTDAGLAHLKDCKGLTYLTLRGTKATDAGLAHFQGCKALTALDVRKTPVTAKGLADFHAAVPGCQITHDGGVIEAIDVDRTAAEWVIAQGGSVRVNGEDRERKAAADLPKERFTLTKANLSGTKATDASLAPLRHLRGLTHLELNYTPVSDAGLAHIRSLPKLEMLSLIGTKVSDAGLADLKGLDSLTNIHLSGPQVTDTGMAHLKEFKSLTAILLESTAVSDAGLEHLKGLKSFQWLVVRRSKVTAKGVEALRAARPGCRVDHDDK